MIITVTPNTSIDYVTYVPEWDFNSTLRATATLECIAGKPTDASYILSELGLSSLALGFKAGHNGMIVEKILTDRNIITRFVEANGESRRNLVIIYDNPNGQTTITTSTLNVSYEHAQGLEINLRQALPDASCVVLGGTLPNGLNPDYYSKLIKIIREAEVPVIFDASGDYLRAGLKGKPSYIKPNRDELTQLVGWQVDTIDDAYRAGRSVQAQYQVELIISLGQDGGLAILEEKSYYISPISVDVVNTAGAGDAILAGIAASIERKQSIEEGIGLGFAAATAVVIQPGTADCSIKDVEQYRQYIELLPYPAEGINR